jgi:hypothetical protein
LPEYYLWAKIAVAAGGPRGEADYINLPKNYIWKDIYDAVSGTSNGLLQWNEKQALGYIASAYRGDTANPANTATYINWPWRYQVASIIEGFFFQNILLSSPNSSSWEIFVDNDGIVSATLSSETAQQSSIILKKPSGTDVSVSIDDDGVLTTSALGSTIGKYRIFFRNQAGVFFLSVDNSGILTTIKQ